MVRLDAYLFLGSRTPLEPSKVNPGSGSELNSALNMRGVSINVGLNVELILTFKIGVENTLLINLNKKLKR